MHIIWVPGFLQLKNYRAAIAKSRVIIEEGPSTINRRGVVIDGCASLILL